MESTIVDDFQNLRVFTRFDLQRMDELVQDLTNALEETAKSRVSDDPSMPVDLVIKKTNRKRRSRKRRSEPNLIWQYGNFSEASESSLDEALKDYMENVAQQSDSDELNSTNRLAAMSFANPASVPLVESDSFTENFSPMRGHRRRRKFKRMLVDPQPTIPTVSGVNPHSYKPKFKSVKVKHLKNTHGSELIPGDRSGANQTQSPHDTKPGKRKRGMRDKCGNSFENDYSCLDQENMMCDGAASGCVQDSCYNQDSSTSTCGDSDAGIYTNDEGRDGDDEQSDFFYENGPACGIPGIIPWWESEKLNDEEGEQEQEFQRILNGSFDQMSASAQRSFKVRVGKLMSKHGREFRTGRRRLIDKLTPNYTMKSFIEDRNKWDKHGCSWQGGNSNNQPIDTKRLRKTPPPSPVTEGYVGDDAEPIPDSNIGNVMLQSMGWQPGTGLGLDCKGIIHPIMAYRRQRRIGLGSSTPTTHTATKSTFS